MLRPIDVIFKHPTKKIAVIYQNGKLWQLPRLDFDGGSLGYKRAYTGSREQIFVAQDQRTSSDDVALASQLATIDLPVTVVGRNVDEFEHWWRHNGYDYREQIATAKQRQAGAKQRLASPNTPMAASNFTSPAIAPSVSTVPPTPPAQKLVTPDPVPQPQPQPQPPSINTAAKTTSPIAESDDIFDQLMGELTQSLQ